MGYVCKVETDLSKFLDNIEDMFKEKDACSQDKLLQIAQSESNFIEIGENIYQIYKELNDWEPSFETGYNLGTSSIGVLILLEKTYETYQYLECQKNSEASL